MIEKRISQIEGDALYLSLEQLDWKSIIKSPWATFSVCKQWSISPTCQVPQETIGAIESSCWPDYLGSTPETLNCEKDPNVMLRNKLHLSLGCLPLDDTTGKHKSVLITKMSNLSFQKWWNPWRQVVWGIWTPRNAV